MLRIWLFLAAVGLAAAARPHKKSSHAGAEKGGNESNATKSSALGQLSAVQAFEDQVVSMMKSGHANTPELIKLVESISSIVESDMKPKVVANRNNQQKEMDQLFAAFGRCSSVHTAAQSDATRTQAQFTTTSQQHQQCRRTHSSLATADAACTAAQTEATDLKTKLCKAVADLDNSKNSLTGNCAVANSGENYGEMADRLKAQMSGMAAAYFQKKQACTDATTALEAKVADCTVARKALTDKKAQCDMVQGQMDATSCSYVTGLAGACQSLDSCYTQSKANFEGLVKTAKVQEASLKTEMSAILRLQCILNVFALDPEGGKREAAMSACAVADYAAEVQKLSLTYQPVPGKDTCTVPTDAVGSLPYKQAQYDILATNSPAAPCTASCCQAQFKVAAVPRSCELRIWEHGNRGGRSAGFSIGDVSFPEFIKDVPNDSVSSLEVKGSPDCRATLFQHAGFGGWAATFPPGFYDAGDIIQRGGRIDDASSAKIFYEVNEPSKPGWLACLFRSDC